LSVLKLYFTILRFIRPTGPRVDLQTANRSSRVSSCFSVSHTGRGRGCPFFHHP